MSILVATLSLLVHITTAHAAKPYDLVCGKILKITPAYDDTGETILKVERQTQLAAKMATYRVRMPLSLRAHRDALLVRKVAKSRDAFCAQTSDGLHLSKFSAAEPKVSASRIPGLPSKLKM